MPANEEMSQLRPQSLPIEIRAALDIVFQLVSDRNGKMRTRLIGDPYLVEALTKYGDITDDASRLTALSTYHAELEDRLVELSPKTVITMAAGGNAGRLRRIRNDPFDLFEDLAEEELNSLGYRQTGRVGLQGIGSFAFATGHLVFSRVGRLDVADRCRIGMLRTLVTSRPGVHFATIVISEYWRAA